MPVVLRCPGCGREYGVPEEQLSRPNARFRCTACGLVFGRSRRRPPAPRREPDRNLAFAFDPPRPRRSDEPPEAGMGDEPAFVRPAPEPLTPGRAAGDDRDQGSEGEPGDETDADEEGLGPADDEDGPGEDDELEGEAEADRTAEQEQEEEREEDGAGGRGARRAMASGGAKRGQAPRLRAGGAAREKRVRPQRRSPVRPVARAVAITVVFYAALTAYLSRRPRLALETVSHVPVIGGLLGDDALLAWRVELTDLRSAIDRIEGGTRALVVSGRAVNTGATPLRIIEVEGRLRAHGRTVSRQRVYAANQFSGTLGKLGANEVEILLRLEPSRRFRIEQGESARFLLVFPNPPPDATAVDCSVIAARPS